MSLLDLVASEDEAQLDPKSFDEDAGSISDSPDLSCVACKRSSKSACPVAARKSALAEEGGAAPNKMKEEVRVGWGKYTARKMKTRSGRKVKARRRCGAWCRICANILKKTLKRKKYKKIALIGLKKKDKHAAVNMIKKELQDGPFTERWMRAHAESVHLHAGGKTRIYSRGAEVRESREDKHELTQSGKFYFLNRYKEEFGDPNITKAKVVKRRWKGKVVRGVVVVSATDAGILDHMTKSSAGVSKHLTKFNGADALVEEDLHDAESDALSEMSEDFPTRGRLGPIRSPSKPFRPIHFQGMSEDVFFCGSGLVSEGDVGNAASADLLRPVFVARRSLLACTTTHSVATHTDCGPRIGGPRISGYGLEISTTTTPPPSPPPPPMFIILTF